MKDFYEKLTSEIFKACDALRRATDSADDCEETGQAEPYLLDQLHKAEDYVKRAIRVADQHAQPEE